MDDKPYEHYEKELKFLQNFLKNSQIPHYILTNLSEVPDRLDAGFCRLLYPDMDLYDKFQEFLSLFTPRTIYRITDAFLCRFLALQLPGSQEPAVFLIIGPYLLTEITTKDIIKNLKHRPLSPQTIAQMEQIYYDIPVVPDESMLFTLINTFGESIWGSMNNFSVQDVHDSIFFDLEPLATRPEHMEPMDAFQSMQILEDRYSLENQIMHAISQGQTHKAEMLASRFLRSSMENRAADPVRNLKNYTIICNTLFRKAAEAGAVHPLHIDSISSRFAHRIEQAYTLEALENLCMEMIHKYCLLVKNYSMKGYSLLVRKILVRIDSDLTADLSLKAQAEFLKVNPSYLSTLFKKETGTTLTEYVNRKRIEQGIFLLNTTTLQVQAIAQNCGIPDVNYFTKTFKKIVGATPKEYRNTIMAIHKT